MLYRLRVKIDWLVAGGAMPNPKEKGGEEEAWPLLGEFEYGAVVTDSFWGLALLWKLGTGMKLFC